MVFVANGSEVNGAIEGTPMSDYQDIIKNSETLESGQVVFGGLRTRMIGTETVTFASDPNQVLHTGYPFGVVKSAADESGQIAQFSSTETADASIRVSAWGVNNSLGQLGDGLENTTVAGISDAVEVSAGNSQFGNYVLIRKSDGTVISLGYNDGGQLGDGTTTTSTVPVSVVGLTDAIAVSASSRSHSMALKSDGTVEAWGRNTFGQLGDGTTTDSSTPVAVSGLTGVAAIAAGYLHSMALKSDGTVVAWGRNSAGQLGDGTTTDSSTPVTVSGLTGAVAIAAGELYSMALKSDGTVVAWGRNNFGQLGDGTTATRLTPVAVSGLTGVVAIAAGQDHIMALKSDGTVVAWGRNSSGQLGDGTTVNRYTPVTVSGITGVVNCWLAVEKLHTPSQHQPQHESPPFLHSPADPSRSRRLSSLLFQ